MAVQETRCIDVHEPKSLAASHQPSSLWRFDYPVIAGVPVPSVTKARHLLLPAVIGIRDSGCSAGHLLLAAVIGKTHGLSQHVGICDVTLRRDCDHRTSGHWNGLDGLGERTWTGEKSASASADSAG